MRSTVAAATAFAVAMAATTATAGVVISENVVRSDQTGTHKSEQTVIYQGNKKRVVTKDRVIITNLDDGEMYVLAPEKKAAAYIVLPPTGVVLAMLSKEGMSVELKKAAGTHKVAGYECQEYAGTQRVGHYNIEVAECVASAAPGAQEYMGFTKALAAKLKGTPLEPKGEIPDGLPVSSTVTSTLIPFPIPRDFPPDLAAKVKESNAKMKPEITRTTVTKIEVKEIAADQFILPAEYKKPEAKPTIEFGLPGSASTPIPAPEQPIPKGALPPVPPMPH
jgi:hypothetical protein